jgi:REP element-mobilizing transposase RayT
MAKKWSNLNLPGALHYVTANIIDRLPVFTNRACCEAFLTILAELNQKWPSKLIAYVLMPDHLHLISNPSDGRIKEFTTALKSLAANRVIEIERRFSFIRRGGPDDDGSNHQVWQESFKATPLWSGWMIRQKINYIHANPVRAGLVKSAKDYQWTSFRAFYHSSGEPLAIDQDWWWPDDSEKLSKAMKELGWRTWEKRFENEK